MAKGAPDWVLPVRVAVQVTGEELVIIPIATKTSTTAQKTVSTAAYKIVDENDDRITVIVINDSTTKCWLGFADTLTTDNGFPLTEGQIYRSDVYKGPIYAITESGFAYLAIIEDTR